MRGPGGRPKVSIGGDFLIFGVLIEMPAASQVHVDMRHGGADRV